MKSMIIVFVMSLIVNLGPLASSQDDISKKYIDLLEKNAALKDENQTLKNENEKLKEKIAELESANNDGSDRSERKSGTKEEKELKDPIPKGLVLKGKYKTEHLGKTVIQGAKFEVVERDRMAKTVTFLQTIDNGAIWEYDCNVVGDKSLQITAVRRIRAANAVVNDPNRPPVGGISGRGTIGTSKLVLEFVWREADNGPLSGRFEFDRAK